MTFCKALTQDELWAGEMVGLRIRGRDVLLVNFDGEVRAYEDRCMHKGLPLRAGRLEGCVLTCPAHGWEYDVRTGRGINPDRVTLRSYVVKVEGPDILIDVGEGEAHGGVGAR